VTRRKAKTEARAETASNRDSQRGMMLAIALVLVAATLAVYGQTLRAEFVTADDGVYVTANPTVKAGLTWEGLRWAFGLRESNWMPLTWLSFMLDATLAGASPRAFHRTNLILHLAGTLVLFATLTGMTGKPGRSGFVAMLFAVHPLHVESVAWVAERKDVLCGLFWMLGMAAWAAYVKRPAAARYALVIVSLALSLMAKPMAVTLPLVFLLLDLWPLRRPVPLGHLVREKIPLLALSAASSIATLIAQRQGGAMSSVEAIPLASRAGNAIVSYAAYLVNAIWPTGLAFFYPHPGGGLAAWQVLLGGALLAGLTLAAWRAIPSRPYVPVGWAWYVVTLLPVIGLVQVGLQARADRYTYLPLIGPFIAVTWGFAERLERIAEVRVRNALCFGTAGVVSVALASAAYVQTGYWHDSVTLNTRALAVTQNNAVAHNDLGLALLEREDFDGAIRHCREALRIDPGHPEAPNHLATALAREGRLEEAFAVYRQALSIRPGDVTLHSNFGTVLGEQGQFAEAAAQFAEAVRLDPDSSDAHYNLGVLLARQERYDAAIAEFLIAERLSPFDPEIRQSLEDARALRDAATP
jgi:Flp pilus assembly protein TadD